MKTAKWKRIMLLSLSILFTLLAIFSAFGLSYAAREKAHEGLTYSQWYEGAIGSYYGILLIFAALLGVCLYCWIGYVFLVWPIPRPKKGLLTAAKILCSLFVLLTCVFVFRTVSSHAEMKRASEIPVDSLAPYLETYGQNRVWALISLEAAALSLFPVFVKKR